MPLKNVEVMSARRLASDNKQQGKQSGRGGSTKHLKMAI